MDPTANTGSQNIQEQIGMDYDSLESTDAVRVNGVSRRRQRTEKGKAYIAHLRWTDCHSIGKRVQRQINEIDSLATNEENVNVVERNLTSFRVTVEEFKGSVAALLGDLETDEELNVANDWYADQSKQINDFIEKIVRWISSAKETIEHSLEVKSQTSSKHSRTSHRSGPSSRPSIATSRAKEKAKAAELMAKVAMLERRQELEKRIERLRLEEQLALAQVRERIYAEFESGDKEDLSPPPKLPSETFRVEEFPFSEPSFRTVSSAFITPGVTSTIAADVSDSAVFHDVPGKQIPPEPTQRPKFNPFAATDYVLDIQQSTTPMSRRKSNPFAAEKFLADIQQSTTPMSRRKSNPFAAENFLADIQQGTTPLPRGRSKTSAAEDFLADVQQAITPMSDRKSNPFVAEDHIVDIQQSTRPVQLPSSNPFVAEPRVDDMHHSTKQFCDVLEKQNKLTELLADQQRQNLLPTLTLSKFTGDPLEYPTFIRSFESQVEAKTSANDVRFQYLEQYLQGEPKELIKGCLYLDRHSGYLEAKRLLKDKYGDPYKISNAYIKKINEWPYIRAGDELALDRFSTFLTQCRSAISSLTFLSILNHPHNLQSMVTRLPLPLQDRWRREANKMRVARGAIPAFADFVDFVNAEAGIATDPVFSREALRRLDGSSDHPDRFKRNKGPGKFKISGERIRNSYRVSSHATGITADQKIDSRNPSRLCKLCSKHHDLASCQAYLKKTLANRKEFLKEKGLCFACYDSGHRSSGCAQRRTCKKCFRRHPTGLHDDNFRLIPAASVQQISSPPQQEDTMVNAHTEMNEAACNATGIDKTVSAVPIVPVRLRFAGSEVVTYAMLDNCSTGSFVLKELAASLGVKGIDTQLMVKTVNGTKLLDTEVLNGLIVTNLNGDNTLQLPKIFTKEDLSTCEDMPTPELAYRWEHLKRIATDLPPQLPDAKIGLLIGSNCPKALEPFDILASQDGGPFAIKTFAGWAIVGPLYMSNKELPTMSCNRVATKEVGSGRHLDHHFVVENKVREVVTPQALNKMFELDFSERTENKGLEYSQDDKKFLKIVDQGIRHTEDNHYEIPLPFRCDDPHFPANKEQVLQRAYWLKKRLIRSETFYKDYVNFMNTIIAKGFARKVPSDLLSTKPGRVWYIPHHGVYMRKNRTRSVLYSTVAPDLEAHR